MIEPAYFTFQAQFTFLPLSFTPTSTWVATTRTPQPQNMTSLPLYSNRAPPGREHSPLQWEGMGSGQSPTAGIAGWLHSAES